jgi:TIR domain
MGVFISYAPADRDWAKKLYRELTEAGLEVWLDAVSLLPGDNWYLETGKALSEADAMVVLLSPAAAEADSVGRDVQYALGSERFRDRLIPVLLQPSDKIPWILRRLKGSQGTPAEVAGQISNRLRQSPAPQGSRASAGSR